MGPGGFHDPVQGSEGPDGLGQMLKHLMGVHDIERRVGEVELVHIANDEPDVRGPGTIGALEPLGLRD